jgi:Tfp pilus assembly protein PilF
MALIEYGEIQEAIKEFRQALQLKPSYAEAHYNLAQALQKIGQADAAAAEFRRAKDLSQGQLPN